MVGAFRVPVSAMGKSSALREKMKSDVISANHANVRSILSCVAAVSVCRSTNIAMRLFRVATEVTSHPICAGPDRCLISLLSCCQGRAAVAEITAQCDAATETVAPRPLFVPVEMGVATEATRTAARFAVSIDF